MDWWKNSHVLRIILDIYKNSVTFSIVNQRKNIMNTHIQTLTDNTPRSRRRVRKALGLDNTATVSAANVSDAVLKATAVVVIVGLLAAMAIPAYVKVKTNNIAEQVYMGNTVSRSDYEYLQTHIAQVNAEYLAKRKPIEVERQEMPIAPESNMTFIVNGKKYKLVPE